MTTINVPMRIESVSSYTGENGEPFHQVWGYVGGSCVTLILTDDEAHQAGLIPPKS